MKTLIIILLTAFSGLLAQGRIIIPEPLPDQPANPVELQSVDVQAVIKNHTASISLAQEFKNNSFRRVEGDYLFPLHGETHITNFALWINGKKTAGQLLDASQAKQTYLNIVRSMKDPALLEYVDQGLFKAHIFPFDPHGTRKIELKYEELLQKENGVYRFSIPIRQSGQGQISKFHLKLTLESRQQLGNIYSPSHQIHVRRLNDKQAEISIERDNMEADKDLVVYYSLASKDIDAMLMGFRPRTDQDGYFIFIAEPVVDTNQNKSQPKDYIFVIDVSGSMDGDKIVQARDALKYCLKNLNPVDRFGIVTFSSDIRRFKNELVRADKDALNNADYFVSQLSSGGGTNINEALKSALALKPNKDERSTNIVFLTDGLPTEGEQNVTRIVQNISGYNKISGRIFSFGVGYDVNTFLLDKISRDHHGEAQYVKPGEKIDVQVASLFQKISNPALTSPELEFAGGDVYDLYPKNLPDLFKGQRITVTGRYAKTGSIKITLRGKQSGKEKSFSYSVKFPHHDQDNEYISGLWANRKVAHLMEEIRFNGENQELVNTIKKLGEEYGIVTPYTSYLVTEQQQELQIVAQQAASGKGRASANRMQQKQMAREVMAEADEEALGGGGFYDVMASLPVPAAKSHGKKAVQGSRIMKRMANMETSIDMLITVKRISDKTFKMKNGVWYESGYADKDKFDYSIKYLSDAYFNLIEKDDTIKRILALGTEVVFEWNDKTYKIFNEPNN